MPARTRLVVTAALSLVMTSGVLGQGAGTTLPADVRRALEARRAEIDRLQSAAKDPAAAAGTLALMPSKLRAEAGAVSESRSSLGAGTLNIQLAVFTEEIPANAFILRHEILSAVDDQGRAVLPSTNPGASGAMQARGEAPRLVRALTFQTPSRQATAIKAIDGRLEIFIPSEATGSLVTVPGFANQAGKVLSHPTLAQHGIEITCMTKEMYDTLKPQWEKSAASVAQPPQFPTSAVFLVKDRDNRIGGVELRAPDGTPLPNNSQSFSTNVLGTSLVVVRTGGPIRPDAEVRFFIPVPTAVRLFPFRLENIPLP